MTGLSYLCRRLALPVAGIIAVMFAPAARSGEPLPARGLSLVSSHPKGWVIDLEKDGSGAIRHGASDLDPATFPTGTVSFPQVLQWAETRRRVAPGHPESVYTVIDRSAPGTSGPLSEESRAMGGDWEVIGRQILPHLRARDVPGTLELLRAHPLIKEPGELAKIVEPAPPPGTGKTEPLAEEPAVLVEMKRTVSGWSITVHSDGSGSIGWGSTAGDLTGFPKETVSFKDLVAAAGSKRRVGLVDPQSVQVLVATSVPGPPEKSGIRAMSREWEAIGKQILPHLEVWSDEQRVAELLANHPLVMDPGARPVFHKPTGRPPRPRPPRKEPGD